MAPRAKPTRGVGRPTKKALPAESVATQLPSQGLQKWLTYQNNSKNANNASIFVQQGQHDGSVVKQTGNAGITKSTPIANTSATSSKVQKTFPRGTLKSGNSQVQTVLKLNVQGTLRIDTVSQMPLAEKAAGVEPSSVVIKGEVSKSPNLSPSPLYTQAHQQPEKQECSENVPPSGNVKIPCHHAGIMMKGNAGMDNVKCGQYDCEDWKLQYNNIYAARLEKLRGVVFEKARKLWSWIVVAEDFSNNLAGYKRFGHNGRSGGEIVLVGILFKTMKCRPSLDNNYSGNTDSLLTQKPDAQQNFCSDCDVAWLEDDTMRLRLILTKNQIECLATGFIVAVRGAPQIGGSFKVTDLCFAMTPLAPWLPFAPPWATGLPGPFLALVSGLAFGQDDVDGSLAAARAQAANFLMGKYENVRGFLPVQQLIICGGTFALPANCCSSMGAVVGEVEALLAQLVACIRVDVMPGISDLTNYSLPQMPLHPHFFRRVRNAATATPDVFKSVSNPYKCAVDNLSILGHSGQPVEDLLRCTRIRAPIEALKTTLEASHLAPTAPDTLATKPFLNVDPFIIDPVPHVLFSGGHDQEAHEWCQSPTDASGTMCICVPAFHRKPMVVLLNLHDPRDVRVQTFCDKRQPGDMHA